MKQLLTILFASVVAAASMQAIAADPPKDSGAATKTAPAKLEKPADVTAEAWAKMTDAEKQKAVDKAKAAAAEPKKAKKGGC